MVADKTEKEKEKPIQEASKRAKVEIKRCLGIIKKCINTKSFVFFFFQIHAGRGI